MGVAVQRNRLWHSWICFLASAGLFTAGLFGAFAGHTVYWLYTGQYRRNVPVYASSGQVLVAQCVSARDLWCDLLLPDCADHHDHPAVV